jgi:hypothetical protein
MNREAGTYHNGTGCIAAGTFPSNGCPFCGYDPHDAIMYQCKQNDEDLTEEEWQKEIDFYLYENHPSFCSKMEKYIEICDKGGIDPANTIGEYAVKEDD